MTIFEFENLTGVSVTAKEYDAIEAVYMASDVDKFEFCKQWSKMNASRVANAKKLEKENSYRAVMQWRAMDLYHSLKNLKGIVNTRYILSKKQVEAVKFYGLEDIIECDTYTLYLALERKLEYEL